MMITQEKLHQLFNYENGNLVWKTKPSINTEANDVAGSNTKNGYIKIGIDNKQFFAHRMIFLFHHGYLPKFIDHIDRNRKNNCIENLREATSTQNQGNKKFDKRNTSGFRGVTWNKKANKWQAQIKTNNKQKYIGLFLTPESAYVAYCKIAKEYFGEYANI